MDARWTGLGQRSGCGHRVNRIIGVDIGGANLKYASSDGISRSSFFPLWKSPDELANELARDLSCLGGAGDLVVTMTGELADCFLDRETGVAHIVQQTLSAASSTAIPSVHFYGVDGCFHHPDQLPEPDTLAASNWHALASYVGTEIAPDAMLIDIGSTTTDIIPIRAGNVATPSKTDFDRLREGSLVYVGCRRTPVCALVDHLTIGTDACPVMNEYFATTDDARLVLGLAQERPDDHDTADGQPRTSEYAANRLARMIGLDRRQVGLEQARHLADELMQAAKHQIMQGIQQVSASQQVAPTRYVCSGHAPDMLDLPNDDNVLVLADKIGEGLSRCAPAYAVTRLWAANNSE